MDVALRSRRAKKIVRVQDIDPGIVDRTAYGYNHLVCGGFAHHVMSNVTGISVVP